MSAAKPQNRRNPPYVKEPKEPQDGPLTGSNGENAQEPSWGECLRRGMCSSSELASIDIRSPEPLVDDWLRGGDLGFIFAQRGIGKTWIGLDLAHGIAEKRDVGPWKVHTQAKCLYLDGEMPPADIKKRDYALGKPSEASPTSITKFYSSGPGSDVLVLVNTFIFSLSVFFGLAFVTSRSAVDQTHNESTGHGISTVCRHSSVHVFPGVRARKTRHALLPQNRVTIVVETNWLASKRNREITKTITSGNRPEAHPRPTPGTRGAFRTGRPL
jgi:AAA domain